MRLDDSFNILVLDDGPRRRNSTEKLALIEAVALVSTWNCGWYDCLGTDLLEEIVDNRENGKMRTSQLEEAQERLKSVRQGTRVLLN